MTSSTRPPTGRSQCDLKRTPELLIFKVSPFPVKIGERPFHVLNRSLQWIGNRIERRHFGSSISICFFGPRERANVFQRVVYGFLISRGPKLLVANFAFDASAACLVLALALASDERRSFRLKGITRADTERLLFTLAFITAAPNTIHAMSNITHAAMLTTRITASDSTKLKSSEDIGGQESVRVRFSQCAV
jgi:hypothetical protein